MERQRPIKKKPAGTVKIKDTGGIISDLARKTGTNRNTITAIIEKTARKNGGLYQ